MGKDEFCIMPNNPPRWYNERINNNLVRHEIFFGKNRQKSIEDGLVVFLTPELHNMSNYGVHFNHSFDTELKQIGQKTWQTTYKKTEEDFISRYGRSYL